MNNENKDILTSFKDASVLEIGLYLRLKTKIGFMLIHKMHIDLINCFKLDKIPEGENGLYCMQIKTMHGSIDNNGYPTVIYQLTFKTETEQNQYVSDLISAINGSQEDYFNRIEKTMKKVINESQE